MGLSGFAFRFFSDSLNRFITENVGLFLVSLLMGIILSALGTLAWTQHFNRRRNFKVAGWIFLALAGLLRFPRLIGI
jgi:uncharacterized membrane protein YidH (DUF202 family)